MDRPGKALERLITLLESELGESDVCVESPAYLTGKDSGSSREVDLALRSRLGSSEVLIVFECRDHKRKQSTPWIEQLAQKRRDVGADKVVAVSSSGFTKPALRLAKSVGVETRTVNELNPLEIRHWLTDVPVVLIRSRSRFHSMLFCIQPEWESNWAEIPDDFLQEVRDRNQPCYRWYGQQNRYSLYDVWKGSEDVRDLQLRLGRRKAERRFRIRLNTHDSLFLVTPVGEIPLTSIELDTELWSDHKAVEAAAVQEYLDDSVKLSEVVKYEIPLEGNPMSMQFVSLRGGNKRFIAADAPHGEIEYQSIVVEEEEDLGYG